MSIASALSGYKTYLATAAGAVGTVAAVAGGTVTPVNGAIAIALLLATAFSRAGSKTDAAKVIAHVNTVAGVAASLAPVAAAIAPGAAKVADAIGTVAQDIAEQTASAPQPTA